MPTTNKVRISSSDSVGVLSSMIILFCMMQRTQKDPAFQNFVTLTKNVKAMDTARTV